MRDYTRGPITSTAEGVEHRNLCGASMGTPASLWFLTPQNMQAGGKPFHSPKLKLHQEPIIALEGGRNFGSPGNADKGLSSAQQSAGVGIWTAFHPKQIQFSSPFLTRKELTQSSGFRSQPRATLWAHPRLEGGVCMGF